MTRQELKIVSGGQTGVDQGALEAALGLGLVWGGWVPKGWRAENGTIPEQFRARMQEHASANYIVRTRQNVADSHATLILTDAYPLSGGTQRTRDFCMNMMKSHFVVSFGEADAIGKVRKWLRQFFAAEHPMPFVLNVAGPRESKSPGIQSRTRLFLTEVLGGMSSRQFGHNSFNSDVVCTNSDVAQWYGTAPLMRPLLVRVQPSEPFRCSFD